ncbi:HNH endonuclease, partial [Rhodococcus sp. 06-418-5]
MREAITKLHDTYGGKTPPADDTDRNELFASKTLNGRLVLKGDFDAITGEKLLTALSPLTEPRPDPDGTETPKTGDDRSPARRRADAFGHILDQYLASSNRPTEGGERPHLNLHISLRDLTDLRDSADVDDIADDENTRAADESDTDPVTADRGAYRDLFGDGTTVGWLPWMGPLSRNTSRQLACDCLLTAIVMDE